MSKTKVRKKVKSTKGPSNRRGVLKTTTKLPAAKIRKGTKPIQVSSSEIDSDIDSKRDKKRRRDKKRDTINTSNRKKGKKNSSNTSEIDSDTDSDSSRTRQKRDTNRDTTNTSNRKKNKKKSSKDGASRKRNETVTDPHDKCWYYNGFGERIIPYLGLFSLEESNLIRKAIENHCKTYDIPVEDFCDSTRDFEKQGLGGGCKWKAVAQVLPNRTVSSIRRHGIRIMHPFKRGVWTNEEVELLKALVKEHGKKWVQIQLELRRSSEACRDKYRDLRLGCNSGDWSKQEIHRLEDVVREVAEVSDNVDMAQVAKMIETKEVIVSWIDVSGILGTRSRIACYKKFNFLANVKKPKKPQVKDSRHFPKVLQSHVSRCSWRAAQGDFITIAGTQVTSSPFTPSPIRRHYTTNSTAVAKSDMSDEELIKFLALSSYKKKEDVNWESEEVENRWELMVENFIENFDDDLADEILNYPLQEIAKVMIPDIEED